MARGDRPPLAEAMRYAHAGTLLIAPMLGLGAVGHYLDGRWSTAPWIMVAGLLLGMAGGFVNFIRLVTARPPGGPAPGRDGRPGGGEDR